MWRWAAFLTAAPQSPPILCYCEVLCMSFAKLIHDLSISPTIAVERDEAKAAATSMKALTSLWASAFLRASTVTSLSLLDQLSLKVVWVWDDTSK